MCELLAGGYFLEDELEKYGHENHANDKYDGHEKCQGAQLFHDELEKTLVAVRGEFKNHLQRINGKAQQTGVIIFVVFFSASHVYPVAGLIIYL